MAARQSYTVVEFCSRILLINPLLNGEMARTEAETQKTDWQAVIGRALAHLALTYGMPESSSVTEKAQFLIGLGLSRAEAASILGSTDNSLRVNLARKKLKGGARARTQTKAKGRRVRGTVK
jgi:hypothetical protein